MKRIVALVAVALLVSVDVLRCSAGAAERPPLVFIFDSSYDVDEALAMFGEVLLSLNAPRIVYAFDERHKQLGKIDIQEVYPANENLFKQRYGAAILEIANQLKARSATATQRWDLPSHLAFAARKGIEMSGEEASDGKAETVIYTNLQKERFAQVKALAPTEPLSGLLAVDSPYKFSDGLNGVILHLVFNDPVTNGAQMLIDPTEACEFLQKMLQIHAGRLATCQSETIDQRIDNDRVYLPLLTENQLRIPIPSEVYRHLSWGDSTVTLSNMQPAAEGRPSGDTAPQDGIVRRQDAESQTLCNGCAPRVHVVQLNPAELPHAAPLRLSLVWNDADTDMDLSLYSKTGRLHFASTTAWFGVHEKHGRDCEELVLSEMPREAIVRIVHASGGIPTSLTLRVQSENGTTEHILDDLFREPAEWKRREFVLSVPLRTLLDREPLLARLGAKPRRP